MQRVLVLVFTVAVVWGCLAYPAWLKGGQEMLLQSAVAACVCLLPAVLTLAGGQYILRQAPELSMMYVAGSTGFRMLFVLVVGLVLTSAVPSFRGSSLWLWIVGFYFLTLALETILLVRGRGPSRPVVEQPRE